MRNFIKHDIPSIKRIDADGKRSYLTPTGKKYPSVTNVVSAFGKEGLAEWRKRVGEEEANKITARAAKRGTAIHTLCEHYLLGKDPQPDWWDLDVFNSMRPLLDRIDNIHCLETSLFSHHLEVAGTVDCIAEFDGKLSVIDFKTSKQVKKKEWIHSYFMQESAYAVSFEELTGVSVPRLVTIMGIDDEEPMVYIEKRNEWVPEFKKMRKQYREVYGM